MVETSKKNDRNIKYYSVALHIKPKCKYRLHLATTFDKPQPPHLPMHVYVQPSKPSTFSLLNTTASSL